MWGSEKQLEREEKTSVNYIPFNLIAVPLGWKTTI
jgi:hypothetical protein